MREGRFEFAKIGVRGRIPKPFMHLPLGIEAEKLLGDPFR